jgi:hypothetical protein
MKLACVYKLASDHPAKITEPDIHGNILLGQSEIMENRHTLAGKIRSRELLYSTMPDGHVPGFFQLTDLGSRNNVPSGDGEAKF